MQFQRSPIEMTLTISCSLQWNNSIEASHIGLTDRANTHSVCDLQGHTRNNISDSTYYVCSVVVASELL